MSNSEINPDQLTTTVAVVPAVAAAATAATPPKPSASLIDKSKFYVLSGLTGGLYNQRIEYWVSNDPKEIREIYRESTWLHNTEHYTYVAQGGKSFEPMVLLKNSHRKIYDTDLSDVHICKKCSIFYLKKQVCDKCQKDTTDIEDFH